MEVEVCSKSRNNYVLSLSDSVNQISLTDREFDKLLEQQSAIYNKYSEFARRREETIKKQQLLQNLLAYHLNGKKVNNYVNINGGIIACPNFEQATEMIEKLWYKLDSLV